MFRFLSLILFVSLSGVAQTESLPDKFTLSFVTSPDSIQINNAFKFAVRVENTKGTLPVDWCGTLSLKDSTIIDTSDRNNIRWHPTVIIERSIYPLFSPVCGNINVCFSNSVDTMSVIFPNWGLFKISIALSGGDPKQLLFDSTLSFFIKQPLNQTSIKTLNTRMEDFAPCNVQVLNLQGKTVARFSNVTSYNLSSRQIPKGTYILRASTGLGNPWQRIVTLFQ